MSQGYGGGGPLPPGYPPGGGGPPGYPPGGGGPPGYPPGGGGPPGYPPGGGGPPGYPPGGGGPPGYPPGGGGPPGYPPGGPPPGYPQGYEGAPAAPKKKTNPLVWVGLGCGTLLLLGLVAGGVAVYFTQRAAKQALESLNGVASAFGSAAAAPAVPGAPALAASGTCQSALVCCQKIVRKTGGTADAEAACSGLAQLNDAQCALTLKGYHSSAQLLGVTCE